MNIFCLFYQNLNTNGLGIDTIAFIATAVATWALFFIGWRQMKKLSREAWRERIIEVVSEFTGQVEHQKLFRLNNPGAVLSGREGDITKMQNHLSLLLLEKKYKEVLDKAEQLRKCAETFTIVKNSSYFSIEGELFSLVRKVVQ